LSSASVASGDADASADDLGSSEAPAGSDDLGTPSDASKTQVAPDLAPDLAPVAPLPCAVNGQQGLCLEVSQCFGVATPGHCPGPTGIQCCTNYIIPPFPFP